MITVCLNISRTNPLYSERKILDFKNYKAMKECITYISKYPDVINVFVEEIKKSGRSKSKI